MKLTLLRTYRGTDCTLGVLTMEGGSFQTIERPWVADPKYKGGRKGVSCVPEGIYHLECHNSEAHPRTWALVNPELGVSHWPQDAAEGDRTAVLIHVANFASELRGCIAPGMSSTVDPARGRMVTKSRVAMEKIQELLNWSEHELEIK